VPGGLPGGPTSISDTREMATLQQRLRAFLNSPQGKQLIAEGQRQLAKPENQRRLRRLIAKLQSRR
jgi:hypothetical protein